MNKFYQVVVKIKWEDDKGKVKTRTERYLVDAMSVAEAEARVTLFMADASPEYAISSVTESRIIEVVSPKQTPECYEKSI